MVESREDMTRWQMTDDELFMASCAEVQSGPLLSTEFQDRKALSEKSTIGNTDVRDSQTSRFNVMK